MRAKLCVLLPLLFSSAVVCLAQTNPQAAPPTQPQIDYTAVNCSGFVTDQKVPDEIRLISGEQSNYKITFARGDYVYINRGQDKGIQVGDQFSVVRPTKDPNVDWFKKQDSLMRAMGTHYTDAGQLRVIHVEPKTATAEVSFSCGVMLRGDVVRRFVERPVPQYKEAAVFDHFAPASGKSVAMVVNGADYAPVFGKHSIIYVNLGGKQGVRVGDYFRIFRYQGSSSELAPQTQGSQYMMFGYGSTPERYTWKDLPREILGEGIVLNTNGNASTVLITFSAVPVYAGDFVEVE